VNLGPDRLPDWFVLSSGRPVEERKARLIAPRRRQNEAPQMSWFVRRAIRQFSGISKRSIVVFLVCSLPHRSGQAAAVSERAARSRGKQDMKPFLRVLGRRLRRRAQSSAFRWIVPLTVGFGMAALAASHMPPVVTVALAQNASASAPKELPPWEQRPQDMRAANEANKQALRLMTAVFAARLRRGEVEFKFIPKIAPPYASDPLSGPNDLAVSPLLQDFGQGAVWLSVILTANPSELSPRLQAVQQALLEGLKQSPTARAGDVKKQIRKPARSKELEDSGTAEDIQRVLQAERNYQEVVSQLRSAFPKYAELYLHQSPRVLNRPGMTTVFELCDPDISFDPLEKNERMQASLIVKVYRYEEHSFKIVSFWLYRNIEDPEIFVPRALYSEKGRDVTHNNLSQWDETHMPPRTFSSVGYVSQAVTVITLKFVVR
jgi:hypothetical protein